MMTQPIVQQSKARTGSGSFWYDQMKLNQRSACRPALSLAASHAPWKVNEGYMNFAVMGPEGPPLGQETKLNNCACSIFVSQG